MSSGTSEWCSALSLNPTLMLLKHRCRNTHDIDAYLQQKPKDVLFPSASELAFPPNVDESTMDAEDTATPPKSINWNARCPIYDEDGECRHGLKCRFLGGHVRKREDGTLELLRDEEKASMRKPYSTELNMLPSDKLKKLRTKSVSASLLLKSQGRATYGLTSILLRLRMSTFSPLEMTVGEARSKMVELLSLRKMA